MFAMDELFDKREIVGARLGILLKERNITKSKLCDAVGISRPTLNKLLSGLITNKATFANHMEKILKHLDSSTSMLMKNVDNPNVRIQAIRKVLRIKAETIHEETGVTPKRLEEIESGASATMRELRDIALALGTGVNSILGVSIFSPYAATLSYFLDSKDSNSRKEIGGFWGHIGIQPTNVKEYHWYPISSTTRNTIFGALSQRFLVIPCMNNTLLLMNTRNISNVVMLDEACDEPGFCSWDPKVSCGEIPQVVYESLDDYVYQEEMQEFSDEDFSPRFLDVLRRIVEDQEWSEEEIYNLTNSVTIYYADGKKLSTSIDCNANDSLIYEVEGIYNFGGEIAEGGLAYYSDYNGAEIFVNIDHISVIEFPLAQVEKALILANADEGFEDD